MEKAEPKRIDIRVTAPDLAFEKTFPAGTAVRAGRSEDSDLRLPNPCVSRSHFILTWRTSRLLGDRLWIEVSPSASNPVLLGPRRIRSGPLGRRARLDVGPVRIAATAVRASPGLLERLRWPALASTLLILAAGLAWTHGDRSMNARKNQAIERKIAMSAPACACSSEASCVLQAARGLQLADQALARASVEPASLPKARRLALSARQCLAGVPPQTLHAKATALIDRIEGTLETEKQRARLIWDLSQKDKDASRGARAGARLLDLLGPEDEAERRRLENALKQRKGL
ncbi:MAG: FHA domain-containing protein [Phycisphaerae bacterium]|nr:FHA domain-containing protein [Phycisphaerae bacterium]